MLPRTLDLSAMRVRLFLLVLFSLLVLTQVSGDEPATIRYNGVLATSGWIDSTGWHEQGLKILRDFGSYHNWATRWLDGKDEVSHKFWAWFTDFVYEKPDTLYMVYDVNLGWPFGSTGNKAKFTIASGQDNGEVFRFVLAEKPFGVEDAQLIFSGEHTADGKTGFRFSLQVKFIWLLYSLINFEDYSRDMNYRIKKITENLVEAAQAIPSQQNP